MAPLTARSHGTRIRMLGWVGSAQARGRASSCPHPDAFRPQVVLPCCHDRSRADRQPVHDQATESWSRPHGHRTRAQGEAVGGLWHRLAGVESGREERRASPKAV